MLTKMKNFEIPSVNNVYSTLFHLTELFRTLTEIRIVQEKYRESKEKNLLKAYNVKATKLDVLMQNIRTNCTSLTFIDEFLKIKLEESKAIELSERKYLSGKEHIKAICRNHYINVNNGILLSKLTDRMANGFFEAVEYAFYDGYLIVTCTRNLYIKKLYYFSTDLILIACSFWYYGEPTVRRIINKELFDKYTPF